MRWSYKIKYASGLVVSGKCEELEDMQEIVERGIDFTTILSICINYIK